MDSIIPPDGNGIPLSSYTFANLQGTGVIEVKVANSGRGAAIYLLKYAFESSGGAVGAENGLNNLGNGNIKLGGSLNAPTNIALAGNAFSIQGSGGGAVPRLSLNSSAANLGFNSGSTDRNIIINSSGFTFLQTGNNPTTGQVWTALDTNGRGYWADAGAGSTPNFDTVMMGQGGQTTADRIIELGSLNDITFRSRPTGAIPGRVFFSHWRQDGGSK